MKTSKILLFILLGCLTYINCKETKRKCYNLDDFEDRLAKIDVNIFSDHEILTREIVENNPDYWNIVKTSNGESQKIMTFKLLNDSLNVVEYFGNDKEKIKYYDMANKFIYLKIKALFIRDEFGNKKTFFISKQEYIILNPNDTTDFYKKRFIKFSKKLHLYSNYICK